MRLIFASSESKAREAAKRRGMRPGVDCILVWDMETLQTTCLQDYLQTPIEEDTMNIPVELRVRMNNYLAALNDNPKVGFGYRNWHADVDKG